MAAVIGFLLTTLTLLLGELRSMHHHVCGIVKQVDIRAEYYYQIPNLRYQPFLEDYMNIQRSRDCNNYYEDDDDDTESRSSPARDNQNQIIVPFPDETNSKNEGVSESDIESCNRSQNISEKSVRKSRRLSITTDEAISLALASRKASENSAYHRTFN